MPKRQQRHGDNDNDDDGHAVAASVAVDEDDRKPAAKPTSQKKDDKSTTSSSTADLQQQERQQTTASSTALLDNITPHMERLLRLIQEGTTESAQMAAGQLTQLTQQSSAILLWQVLGRLQAMLMEMDAWKARQNAALAMQGVAANVPVEDQYAFFRDGHYCAVDKTSTTTTTLRIADISVAMLLQEGQELYAAAPSKYVQQNDDAQEVALQQLDQQQQQCTTTNNDEFAHERIQAQRRILARRLGLATVSQALSLQDHSDSRKSDLGDIVSNEDLVATYRQTRKRPRPEKQEKDVGIQHLLVREIKKATQDSTAASHRNPQHLLANELIYRMFDSVWQRRHGGLLGILALLKAWKKTVWEVSSLQTEALFGPWPEDILARSICLLALDRFGDFSGATLDVSAYDTTSNNTRQKSGGVIAPIRELGGQLVSVLWRMAPLDIQRKTLQLFDTILEATADWEGQHGILLALKYILVVEILETGQGELSQAKQQWFNQCLNTCGSVAGRFLCSSNQDVASVAAQILCEYPCLVLKKKSILEALWRAVSSIDSISSCAADMVTLLSLSVQYDAAECMKVLASIESSHSDDAGVTLVKRLLGFLESPFVSVRTATLRSLELLAETKVNQSNIWLSRHHTSLYCETMRGLFSCYMSLADESTLLTEDDVSNLDPALVQLDTTWRTYCELCGGCLQVPTASLKNLFLDILESYFYGSDGMSRPTRYDVLMGSPCSAISNVASHILQNVEIRCYFVTCLKFYLVSPWMHHCELACGLLKRVAQSRSKAITEAMFPLFPLVSDILEKMPVCLRVAHGGYPNVVFDQSLKLKHKENVRKMFSVSNHLSDDYPTGFNLDDVQAILHKHGYKLGPLEYSASDLEGMRVKASAASTALYVKTPSKFTPTVRALMTALKSETSNLRLEETSSALSQLLVDSHKNTIHIGARKKILKCLSAIITDKKSRTTVSAKYASNATACYLGSIPPKTLESTIKEFDFHRILLSFESISLEEAQEALFLIDSLSEKAGINRFLLDNYVEPLCHLSCRWNDESLNHRARSCIQGLCRSNAGRGLEYAFTFASNLIDKESKESDILNGCLLLKDLCALSPSLLGRCVKPLLPVVLKSMTHPNRTISGIASGIFAVLVRVAPLVKDDSAWSSFHGFEEDHTSSVIDHLICGKPLPRKTLPVELDRALSGAGVQLRDYQLEGISWLSFLMAVNLNGALCDSMGLGKTIQALIGIALGHKKYESTMFPMSVVVCPATIVNHWVGEIRRFFPGDSIFRPCAVLGDTSRRKELWNSLIHSEYNLVMLSYGNLRTDIKEIEHIRWVYCVLDEGHVLRNPKTATAVASRRICSKHRIVLSGTMIQNKVLDVWATFDFLMPNFLGSSRDFSENFARPITKSQLPGATADCIRGGMEKLRLLHQQVLPFILRREKDKVLRELPAKNVVDLKCPLSAVQRRLYDAVASSIEARESIALFEKSLDSDNNESLGSNVLRVLLFLRLICTHPSLIDMRNSGTGKVAVEKTHYRFTSSTKFMALFNLLRDCGLNSDGLLAGDNDDSLLLCDAEHENSSSVLDSDMTLHVDEAPLSTVSLLGNLVRKPKCLVFAQFSQTLDAIENFLFKPHMPSLRYLRLDGSVPSESRVDMANRFNADGSISVLLLTTRVGSLGLNLTGASIVVFVEHDFNPFVDEQAMDRVHRIGQQADSVNIYRLVAEETIDEKIMDMQKKKIAMSKAVVNTENSTLYSMGTDRLLDIFTPTASNKDGGDLQDLDAIMARYAHDYESLSVDEFIRSFQA